MESQLNNMIEELFQHAHEKIVVLNRSKEILFMNSQATKELQLSNMLTKKPQVTLESESEWSQFILALEQNMVASCAITFVNDQNVEKTVNFNGFWITENQLILGRIEYNTIKAITMNQHNSSITFQNLMNGMTQGIVLTSLNGKIITANKKALEYIHREFWQIENRSYDCLFEDCIFESALILNYYKKIAQQELANVTVQTTDIYGNAIYLKFVSKINENLGILITTIIDYTETMKLIKKLEHQQSLSFMGLNVATIAHEIRNPLTSIKGFIQMIKGDNEEQEHPYFQIIENELQRMDELLLDILTFSKPKKNINVYVDLQQLIEQVIESMQPKIQLSQSKVTFDYEENILYKLLGHEKRLKQLLINLIKNAIESTEGSSEIFIQLRYTSKDCIQLKVSDNGRGIEKTQINHIFDPYYTTKENGTGVGLLLVQAIVNEHHGTIQVESEEGKGSAFIIEFKLTNFDFECLNDSSNLTNLPSEISYM